jgi:hypothetical protein
MGDCWDLFLLTRSGDRKLRIYVGLDSADTLFDTYEHARQAALARLGAKAASKEEAIEKAQAQLSKNMEQQLALSRDSRVEEPGWSKGLTL